VSDGLSLDDALRAARLKRYLVKVDPGFYVGRERPFVSSERDAREFASVGRAHTTMRVRARRCYSVVPVSH
jgi:hypothetical protein